jgi:hypothetical protein
MTLLTCIKEVWLAQPIHLRIGQTIWLLGIFFIIGLIVYGYHTGQLPITEGN